MDYSKLLSERVRNTKPSATVALADKAAKMKRDGLDVISLAAGEPDFPPPQRVVDATKKAVDDGFTHYTPSRGLPALREGIAKRLKEKNRLDVNPEKELLVTPGAKQSIFYICQVFLQKGLEAMCIEPAWVSYPECISMAEGTYVPVPTRIQDGWKVTRQALDAAWSPKTRLLILCTPSNPTGHMMTEEELQIVRDFAVEKDILVLSDEIYEALTYDGHRHISIGSLPGMKERTFTVSGFSKSFAMTGYRLGYVAGPAPLIDELNKVQQHSATCPTAFAQQSLVGLLDQLDDDIARMLSAFTQRRTSFSAALDKVPGFKTLKPDGSFYLFIDTREVGLGSWQLSEKILNEAHVAFTPGAAFGACGEGFLRASFALEEKRLLEAASRIEKLMKKGAP